MKIDKLVRRVRPEKHGGDSAGTVKLGSFSGNEVFKDEVKDKSQNLEFKPGILGNKPVKVWVTVPFSFKLKN